MTTRFLKCSMQRRSTSLIACLTDRSTCKRDAVLIGVAFFHLCYFLFRHVERMIGSWPCRINALTIDRCAGTLRACRHATAGVRGEKPKRSTNGRQNKETEYINNQRGQRRSILETDKRHHVHRKTHSQEPSKISCKIFTRRSDPISLKCTELSSTCLRARLQSLKLLMRSTTSKKL